MSTGSDSEDSEKSCKGTMSRHILAKDPRFKAAHDNLKAAKDSQDKRGPLPGNDWSNLIKLTSDSPDSDSEEEDAPTPYVDVYAQQPNPPKEESTSKKGLKPVHLNVGSSTQAHDNVAFYHLFFFLKNYYKELDKKAKDCLARVTGSRSPPNFTNMKIDRDRIPIMFFSGSVMSLFAAYLADQAKQIKPGCEDLPYGMQSCDNYYSAIKNYYNVRHPQAQETDHRPQGLTEKNYTQLRRKMLKLVEKRVTADGSMTCSPRYRPV